MGLDRRSAALGWLLFASVLAVTVRASASDTHLEEFLVGTRSVGLGGAFTALSNDPSGLWINPAGLNFARRNDININTSFYGFEFFRLDVTEEEAQDSRDAKGFRFFDDLRIVPVTFGGVIGLGDRMPDKTFPHSIAFLLAFPGFQEVVQERQRRVSADDGQASSFFKHVHRDRTLLAGLGYALRLSGRLSLGLGVFYINRLLDRTDESYHRFTPLDDGDMEFVDLRRHLVHSSHSLMFNAGMRLDLSEAWSLGASLQTPTLALGGQSSLEVISSEARKDPGGTLSTGSDRLTFATTETSSSRPFNLRVGFAYELPETLTVTMDVVVHAPSSYRIFDDSRTESYLTLPARIERRAVVNFKAGFEYLLFKNMSLAAGGFSNLTSAPGIPVRPTREMLPSLNMFGATFATGYYLKHSFIRLGLVVMYGAGHDVVASTSDWRAAEESPGFARVPIARVTFHLYLATTFRY